MKDFRVGYGYDIHRLVEERSLVLCGLEIPFSKGLLGHSDADVAIHALIDALLGALALGDIGHFFPDTDPAYKNANSSFLLKEVIENKAFTEWRINNVDLTVIAQEPKLAPYIELMRESLSELLEIPFPAVSVKAKTAEKLGDIGAGNAMETHVVVSLIKD